MKEEAARAAHEPKKALPINKAFQNFIMFAHKFNETGWSHPVGGKKQWEHREVGDTADLITMHWIGLASK